MPSTPDETDPDGTQSMSKRELKERLESDTREKLGQQQKATKDPEGTGR